MSVVDETSTRDHLHRMMELEERYAKLIDFLTDYIYTVRIQDGTAVETYHGPGCVAITGYTSDDYQANPDLRYSMVPRGDREKVLEQARRADILPVLDDYRERNGEFSVAGMPYSSSRDKLTQSLKSSRRIATSAPCRRGTSFGRTCTTA